MFAALTLLTVTVQPGNTMSGIASSHGVSLAAVEQANPQISDPNVIHVGEKVAIPKGGSWNQANTSQSSPSASSQESSPQASSSVSSSSSASSSSLSDIPGVPSSFAACVAFRESTNGQNPAAHGNVYGIIPASGYNVNGTSLANQKQVFAKLYAQYGTSPWAPSDGC